MKNFTKKIYVNTLSFSIFDLYIFFMEKIKILLVDDHQLIRMGIAALISKDSDIEVVGEAESGQNLVHLVQNKRPNVVLMDISLEGVNGIELTKEITRLFKKVKVLMLSMHVKENYIKDSIQAGALGYVLKDSPKEELIKAIKSVHQGNQYFAKEVSDVIVNSYIKKIEENAKDEFFVGNLTKREIQIIDLIADGLNNFKIAEELNISNRTVDTHRTNILKKTGVKNVAELVKFAIVNKIISI